MAFVLQSVYKITLKETNPSPPQKKLEIESHRIS